MSRLYDRLFVSSAVPDDFKTSVRGIPVVSGDNVAAYYYQGTDQEHWDVTKDFPNLAPPFDRFFLDFRPPAQIVSREAGTQAWHQPGSDRPRAWGLYVQAEDLHAGAAGLTAAEARAALRQERETLVRSMHSAGAGAQQALMALSAQGAAGLRAIQRDPVLSALHTQAQLYRALTDMERESDGELLGFVRGRADGAVTWALSLYLLTEWEAGEVVGPWWFWRLLLRPDGTVYELRDDAGQLLTFQYGQLQHPKARPVAMTEAHQVAAQAAPLLHPALLAVSFMHCKNVSVRQVEHPPKLVWAAARRGRPLVRYHVLEIDPMRQVLRTEGQQERVGLRRALHLCRGHFAHYTEERPLLGKVAGTFWRPMHLRGSTSEGLVLKDYNVLSPDTSPG